MGVHQFRAQLDGGRLKVGNDKMATLLHAHLADCECMCISICVRIRTLDSQFEFSGGQKRQSAVKRRKIDANFYA